LAAVVAVGAAEIPAPIAGYQSRTFNAAGPAASSVSVPSLQQKLFARRRPSTFLETLRCVLVEHHCDEFDSRETLISAVWRRV
jgi:hypothetical protein